MLEGTLGIPSSLEAMRDGCGRIGALGVGVTSVVVSVTHKLVWRMIYWKRCHKAGISSRISGSFKRIGSSYGRSVYAKELGIIFEVCNTSEEITSCI